MAIADQEKSFIISGTGDVLEPEDGIIGIGSGGNFALAAAKVLMESTLTAEEIAKKAISVAAEICVYTNNNITIENIYWKNPILQVSSLRKLKRTQSKVLM